MGGGSKKRSQGEKSHSARGWQCLCGERITGGREKNCNYYSEERMGKGEEEEKPFFILLR